MTERRLRVAIITDWYLPRFGGMELHLHDLAARLTSAGHFVEILTPVPGPGAVDDVRVLRLCVPDEPDGGFRFPPPRQASGADFFYFLELFLPHGGSSVLQRLRTHLDHQGYDLAHIHFANAPFAYAATKVALALGLPVLATFHSVLAHVQIPIAAVFARLMGTAAWKGRIGLTAVSRTVTDTLAPVVDPTAVTILPNAVDTSRWDSVRQLRGASGRRRDRSGRLELVSAMRLHARKRPDALLDAVSALKLKLPAAVNVRIRIAGDGPLRAALERRLARDGLQAEVVLCGQLDSDGIAGLLADADIFLLPSHLESFGLAALEARLSGVPVLAMRNSGVREFLTDGIDSLLAEDDAGFQNALMAFATDAGLRERLTDACRTAIETYGWDSVIKRHLQAYRDVIERGHLRTSPAPPPV
jgi:glycosyltransferase involved in cell wall biosynthesis